MRLPTLGKNQKWLAPPSENGPAKLDKQQQENSTKFTRPEKVQKFSWDSTAKTWKESNAVVQIAVGPFDRGYTRTVYRLLELSGEGENSSSAEYVCKVLDSKTLSSLIGPVTEKMYYRDAQCAIVAQEFAIKFNQMEPPQKIEFCENFIMRLMERPGKPIVAVEKMMHGVFMKHNNNNGAVLSSRLTPQAFSHFTYQNSDGNVLVCDIQGWGNVFTDPQIHSRGSKFGLGDQGTKGFRRFFRTHTCGVICGMLGLTRFVRGCQSGKWYKEEIVQQLQSLGLPVPAKYDNTAPNSNNQTNENQNIDIVNNNNNSPTAAAATAPPLVLPNPALSPDSAKDVLDSQQIKDFATTDFCCSSPDVSSSEEDGEDLDEDEDVEEALPVAVSVTYHHHHHNNNNDDDEKTKKKKKKKIATTKKKASMEMGDDDSFSDSDIISEGVIVPSPYKLVEKFRNASSVSSTTSHYYKSSAASDKSLPRYQHVAAAATATAAATAAATATATATATAAAAATATEPADATWKARLKEKEEEILSLKIALQIRDSQVAELKNKLQSVICQATEAEDMRRKLEKRMDEDSMTFHCEIKQQRDDYCKQLLILRRELTTLKKDVVERERLLSGNSTMASTNTGKNGIFVTHC